MYKRQVLPDVDLVCSPATFGNMRCVFKVFVLVVAIVDKVVSLTVLDNEPSEIDVKTVFEGIEFFSVVRDIDVAIYYLLLLSYLILM